MKVFTITSDDPVGAKIVRQWAFERRLLIDHKRLPDTPAERQRIADARAIADAWEDLPPPAPAKKSGILGRLFGRS